MQEPAAYEMQAFQSLSPLTPEQESHYLQAYLPLVRKVVRQLAPQCSCVMEREDMQQIALIGLLDALRRYGKPDKGFGGYAMQRIRGAVLDALRRLDWRPRQLRQKFYQIKDLIRERRRALGREPEPGDLESDGISAEEYQHYLALEGADTLESLDALLNDRPDELQLQGRHLEEQIVTQHMLSRALQTLSAKEQQILYLYYQQDMNLKEIAQVLELTEARICQINKNIAQKLRAYFTSH